MEEIELELN